MEAEAVSTIFVAGLPVDATYRELENTVRFFPGYEALKISTRAGGKGGGGGAAMFVKFSDAVTAENAAQVLNGVPFDTSYPDIPMRVEIARSDMKSLSPQVVGMLTQQIGMGYGQPPPPPGAPAGLQQYVEAWDHHHHQQQYAAEGLYPAELYAQEQHYAPEMSGKRGREDQAGHIDTLVLLGVLEKGYTEQQLEEFYASMPGFIAFKSNARVGGGFVKFASPAFALQAIDHSLAQKIEAQLARSNMNVGGMVATAGAPSYGSGGFPGGIPPPPVGMPPSSMGGRGGAPPPKRARETQAPGTVDTLVLHGVTEKGFTDQQIEEFFMQVPGFVAYRANARVGGGFVKFGSPQLAKEAIDIAASSGIEAQIARSNMNA